MKITTNGLIYRWSVVFLLSFISEDSEGKKRFSLSLAIEKTCCSTHVLDDLTDNCYKLYHGWGRTEWKEFLQEDRAFSLSRNKKMKSKLIQWMKSRNCDIIEDRYRRQIFKSNVCAMSQSWDIRRNALRKFTEPSTEPPCWCPYVHGAPVCVWGPENGINTWSLLWLLGTLIICTEKTSIYTSIFRNSIAS